MSLSVCSADERAGATISWHLSRVLASYLRDDDHHVELVTLGSGPQDFLQVQRALVFDGQDIGVRMDTYCLVAASGAVMYGGVDTCTVTDRNVHLVFTAAAVDTLGVPPDVWLLVEGDVSAEVTRALVRLLD